MKSFKADYVFPVCADPIKNGVVTVDDFGKIVAISDQNSFTATDAPPPEQLNGILCPGFINTHCHLELSHLHDKILTKTGLVEFIKNVQKIRGVEQHVMYDAAAKADETMRENGIVAVGD